MEGRARATGLHDEQARGGGADEGVGSGPLAHGVAVQRDLPEPQGDSARADEVRAANATQLNGRMVHTDEVAAAALYLATDESAMVTGSNFMIDGGWSAGK